MFILHFCFVTCVRVDANSINSYVNLLLFFLFKVTNVRVMSKTTTKVFVFKGVCSGPVWYPLYSYDTALCFSGTEIFSLSFQTINLRRKVLLHSTLELPHYFVHSDSIIRTCLWTALWALFVTSSCLLLSPPLSFFYPAYILLFIVFLGLFFIVHSEYMRWIVLTGFINTQY